MKTAINTICFDNKRVKDADLFKKINEWIAFKKTTINPTSLIRDLLTNTLDSEIQSLRESAHSSLKDFNYTEKPEISQEQTGGLHRATG